MRLRCHWVLALAIALLVCLAIVVVLPGCAPKKMAAMGPGEAASAPAAAPAEPPGQEATDKSVAGGGGGSGPTPTRAADRKVITTGSMELEVKNLDEAVRALTALVNRSGGFFADKNITRQESWRTASVTIRVPADKFSAIHDGAVALGTVQSDQQKGEDVTKQWQDLEARLRIRKAEENSLLRLLERQGRLQDIMEVEKRLWECREQIEVAEGELRLLRDQVTLATLEVNLREQIPVAVGPLGAWNLGFHVANALHSLGSAVRGIAVAVIYVALPGAVVWVPLLLLILWLRYRQRVAAEARKPAPPAPPGKPLP
jgi:hypothetical protein